MQQESAYWLAWSKIPGVGPVLLKRVWQQFGSLETAWKTSATELGQVEGIGAKLLNTIKQERSQINPLELLETHLEKNPQFWTPNQDTYPCLLLEIPSPPPLLYYQGQVNLLENQGHTPLVGIVGTRYPTEHGRRWTRNIAIALVKHGFTVVSGMAAGIDGIAHQACLEAGGRTIAVLGTGVDMVYPSHHRQLHRDLQKDGLIISEYPAGTPGDRRHFPARNRIIAGLSRAVLVMEAPEKSGALITARYANEFCRDVYTLPNSPEVAQARGCLRLIHQGAEMIVTEDELLEMLGAIPELDQGQQLSLFDMEKTEMLLKLDPELLKIFQVISTEGTSFDVIVEKAGLPTAQVSGGLLQLELEGLIMQLPGMRYQKK
ncbi:DNA processing protein [Crocosphaera subtropica ATCC 51142]|uniref:DNA processing protein n=1 Tax=Crocosphaera subtropica (strain ATCC 51142 / BH68) TaxID=43989 RepID=B1WW39_CROS5|nr:DNA-processing protein DprA [Crocosphaera subtropica]ACB52372.1 DNA processing protein [Crocosphaera subtropica ATCC 51142]